MAHLQNVTTYNLTPVDLTPSSVSPTSLRVLGFYRARQGFIARPGLRQGQRTVELAHTCLKKQGYPTNLNFVVDIPIPHGPYDLHCDRDFGDQDKNSQSRRGMRDKMRRALLKAR